MGGAPPPLSLALVPGAFGALREGGPFRAKGRTAGGERSALLRQRRCRLGSPAGPEAHGALATPNPGQGLLTHPPNLMQLRSRLGDGLGFSLVEALRGWLRSQSGGCVTHFPEGLPRVFSGVAGGGGVNRAAVLSGWPSVGNPPAGGPAVVGANLR